MAMGKLTAWTVPLLLVSMGIVFSPQAQAGGGPNDSFGECDLLELACAAAAAVALSACASATIDAEATFSAGFLSGEAKAKATITACMSIAVSQAVSGAQVVPGFMRNQVCAGEPILSEGSLVCGVGDSNAFQFQTKECVASPLDRVVCGPTGVTYTVSAEKCVKAWGHAASNIEQDPGGLLMGTPASNIKVGRAEAWAVAKSTNCPSETRHVEAMVDNLGTERSAPNFTAPFAALQESFQQSLTNDLRAVFDQQLVEATASWPDNDLMKLVRDAVVQNVHNAVENFAGDVEVAL